MLGNRKKAAEQSRGESASDQGWSTNQRKQKKRKVAVGVGGGTQWLGLCFGNVNEAGNFLCVWCLRVNQRGTEDVWANAARHARGAAGRFED